MPSAELIAIGTELLLGEIQDTNTRYLARALREINVDLFRSTIIGDNVARISALMIEAISRSDIIIATGGLGPTVDDPTREAAANAFNVALEYHPELWQQIQARFAYRGISPSENNHRQAYIPATAITIENPVGTAPAFILRQGNKSLICLPGVPREMETLMQSRVIPYLVETYELQGLIKVKVLHTSGLPESRVDQLVADFETLQNPTLGLLAHPGVVDIRITAKADSIRMADSLIASLEKPVRERFGDDILGRPDMRQISRSVALLLTLAETTTGKFCEFRKLLEPAIAAVAARSATDEQRGWLLATADATSRNGSWEPSVEFHEALAVCSNNEVLRLVTAMFEQELSWHVPGESLSELDMEDTRRAHQSIARAVAAGDADRASSAMLRHLNQFERMLEANGRLDQPLLPRERWLQ